MSRSKKTPVIAPDEIRFIRESLGLTQVQAGELLGGGPRAFSKYERGEIAPAASVVKLLRLLEADSSKLAILTGKSTKPISSRGAGPLEVTGEHIEALTDRSFAVLLRKLLNAEAQANDLPADKIHIAGSITTPDGGEDGRISWEGGPECTAYLPARLSMFQLKAGQIGPTKAADDVLIKKGGTVKGMVLEVLKHGGVYTMLCAHRYVYAAVTEREKKIREALRGAGLVMADNQVAFREADQIADWVNQHPSVSAWLLELTQQGLVSPFRSWTHWADRSEHKEYSWVEDERLKPLQARLRELISTPRGIARIVGFAGVGKSRLALESLYPSIEEQEVGQSLSDLVLYTVESETGQIAIKNAVQNLADSGVRALVVIDRCPMQLHQELDGMVTRQSSRLSLLTIDDEIPSRLSQATIEICEASEAVTKGVIDQVLPYLPSEDLRRLVRFCRGYPKIAVLAGVAWAENTPIAFATDDHLVDAVMLGRNPREPETLRKVAQLLAVFGIVRLDPPLDSQFKEIAFLGRKLEARDLQFGISELSKRGVVQKSGRSAILQPRPIALNLAERQWREWGASEWEHVLAGELSPHLKIQAARQLALLNTTSTAEEITRYVCRLDGPFAGFENLLTDRHMEVLSELAEVDAEIVLRLIEDSLENTNLKVVAGDVRRHLVWTLEKIAFRSDTFESSAGLLLRLAVDENESWSNNATGQFKDLFPTWLGNTAADVHLRLRVLQEATQTNNPIQMSIVCEALLAGITLDSFTRNVGSESHGARPALKPWYPRTLGEVWKYIEGCLDMLTLFARENDETGAKARRGIGCNLRFLVTNGLINAVERIVEQICERTGKHWPEAIVSLNDLLIFHEKELESDVIKRVRMLLARLQPETLEEKVRFLITEMPSDYPVGEKLSYEGRIKQQGIVIRNLALELLAQPKSLQIFLPQLCRGEQLRAEAFGKAMAELSPNPIEWLDEIETATINAYGDKQNLDLMIGFLNGLNAKHQQVVEGYKKRVASLAPLAPALPTICVQQKIKASDIELVISAVQSLLLPVKNLSQWAMGGALTHLSVPVIAPLFDFLFGFNADAYKVGLQLVAMYCYRNHDKLNELRPQIRKVAEYAGKWQDLRPSCMDQHYFEEITSWLLSKGRDDSDARATALSLARGLVDAHENQNHRLARRVVPLLLFSYPEIVWPLISQAIVSEHRAHWYFEELLGSRLSSSDPKEPAIVHLPEETLFAWCHAYPGIAPNFVATIVPFLSPRFVASADPFAASLQAEARGIPPAFPDSDSLDSEMQDSQIHPLVRRLLEEFGNQDDVLTVLGRFLYSFSWSGSLTTYYSLFENPLQELLQHQFMKVRTWARNMLRQLSQEKERARNNDAERQAYHDF